MVLLMVAALLVLWSTFAANRAARDGQEAPKWPLSVGLLLLAAGCLGYYLNQAQLDGWDQGTVAYVIALPLMLAAVAVYAGARRTSLVRALSSGVVVLSAVGLACSFVVRMAFRLRDDDALSGTGLIAIIVGTLFLGASIVVPFMVLRVIAVLRRGRSENRREQLPAARIREVSDRVAWLRFSQIHTDAARWGSLAAIFGGVVVMVLSALMPSRVAGDIIVIAGTTLVVAGGLGLLAIPLTALSLADSWEAELTSAEIFRSDLLFLHEQDAIPHLHPRELVAGHALEALTISDSGLVTLRAVPLDSLADVPSQPLDKFMNGTNHIELDKSHLTGFERLLASTRNAAETLRQDNVLRNFEAFFVNDSTIAILASPKNHYSDFPEPLAHAVAANT